MMKRRATVIIATAALITGLIGFFLLLPQPAPLVQEAQARPVPLLKTDRALSPEEAVFAHFDAGELDAAFGFGWQETTDELKGGGSTVELELVEPGAEGSTGALSVRGTITADFPFPWAGAMIFPGDTPLAPVDFSAASDVVFFARGDGANYRLLLFAKSLGQIPSSASFSTEDTWREYRISLHDLAEDLRGVWGLAFVAGPGLGEFDLTLDQVRIE